MQTLPPSTRWQPPYPLPLLSCCCTCCAVVCLHCRQLRRQWDSNNNNNDNENNENILANLCRVEDKGQRTRAYYARIRIVASASPPLLPLSLSTPLLLLLLLLVVTASVCCCLLCCCPPWKSIVFTFTCGSGKLHKLKFENVNHPTAYPPSPHPPLHVVPVSYSSPSKWWLMLCFGSFGCPKSLPRETPGEQRCVLYGCVMHWEKVWQNNILNLNIKN